MPHGPSATVFVEYRNLLHLSSDGGNVREHMANHRKVTDRQVRDIRALFATGAWSISALSARYDLSRTHIRRIVRGASR